MTVLNTTPVYMNIFVVNCGSSSIKYQLFRWPAEQPVCSGLAERIGQENAVITHKTLIDGRERTMRQVLVLPDHEAGLREVVALLTSPIVGAIRDPAEIDVVGHRVVHGGEQFTTTTEID